MSLYIGIIFLILMFWVIKLDSKIGIPILFFLMFLVLSLRSWDLGINDTYGVYYPAFVRMKNTNSLLQAVYDPHFIYEPFMAGYVWCISHIIQNFQFFLSVSSLFPLLSFMWLIFKNERYRYLILLCFFTMYYFYAMFLIKQMISIAFVIIAYREIEKNNFFRFLFWVVVASLFHKSAWIFLIAYPICKLFKFRKLNLILFGFFIVIGALIPSTIVNSLINIDPTGLINSYISDGIYSLGNGSYNFGIFLNIGFLFFCWLRRSKVNKVLLNKYDKLLVITAIGCILNSYSVVIVEFYRLAIFFLIFLCILLPIALDTINNPIAKQFSILLFTILIIVYCLTRVTFNTMVIPYRTFFSPLIY